MRKIMLNLLVLMAFAINASAQDRTVTGKVTDEKGNPISNVIKEPQQILMDFIRFL